jgi:hypothetical protein
VPRGGLLRAGVQSAAANLSPARVNRTFQRVGNSGTFDVPGRNSPASSRVSK